MPPLHITGSSRNWYSVIEKIRHWQQIMTREEQDAEIARGVLHLRPLRRLCASEMKAHLMENRPLLLPNNVPLSTPAAHEARRSSARQNSIALEELTQREVARTSDPIVQQNARIRAGLGTAPVSLASTQDVRSGFIELRQEKRGRVPVRSIGQNATSVGQQADRKAMDALHLSQRAVAKAEDTLYYPNLLPGQAIKTQVLITYNEVEDSNENGGVAVGRKLEKPSVTVIARSKDVASSESTHILSMPPYDNAVTNKGCDDLNDDIMHMNVITITSTEGGREVNLRILSL